MYHACRPRQFLRDETAGDSDITWKNIGTPAA